jgi:hypothetical protein
MSLFPTNSVILLLNRRAEYFVTQVLDNELYIYNQRWAIYTL